MPAYGSRNYNISLSSGEGLDVITTADGTPVPTNFKSIPVALVPRNDNAQAPFSVDINFSGAPGVFQFDIQGAEYDTDSKYTVLPNGAISTVDADSGGTNAHYENPNSTVRFVRIFVKTQSANSVTAVVTIKR